MSTGGADEALRAEIFAEANYYQVLGLAALVSGPEERLLACAAAGGSVKHDEDRLRALVVREPGHATLAMAALLASGDVIDAHAEASAKTFVDESDRAPPAPIVLGGGRRAWRLRRAGVEPGGASIASRDEFVKNWRTFTLGRLDRLNWTGVVAAGGAVAAGGRRRGRGRRRCLPQSMEAAPAADFPAGAEIIDFSEAGGGKLIPRGRQLHV